ncbi:MAG TPA: DUF502 domain-containing protein [Gammaproteobacteria bacterium]|nr:DUF502 domain-containing protein [Gammaproteobacteria bacterium]
MWRKVSSVFLTGLAAVVPTAITLAILWWFAITAENLLGGLIKTIIPQYYVPGMGIIAGVILVFLVGMLVQAWIFRKLFSWGDICLNRIPLVKTVYGAARDLMEFVSGESHSHFNKVVLVSLPGMQARMIGFVTREDLSHLPAEVSKPGTEPDIAPDTRNPQSTSPAEENDAVVSVYFPMSYTIGGYTMLIPRSALIPIDMHIEDAMRFALTAGMSVKKD